MLRRSARRLLLSCLLTMVAFQTARVWGTELPHTVSPGDSSRQQQISSPCPTFTWTLVQEAPGYEIVVYRVVDGGEKLQRVVSKTFEGAVDGWTPSLEDCLSPGGRYAWSVRVAVSAGDADWASPSHFEVVAGPPAEWLETALRTAEARAAHDVGYGYGRHVTGKEGTAERTLSPEPSVSRSVPAAAVATGIEMSVEGGIEASSFIGDGFGLSSLDPGSFVAGTAPIAIWGLSGGLADPCMTCVTSYEIGAGQVRRQAFALGGIKAIDIDPSTVQARVSSSCDSPRLAIKSVGNDGSTTCEESTRVEPGLEHTVSNFNGGSTSVSVTRENRLCFLTYVSFRDVHDNNDDASCTISLVAGETDSWTLTALSDNNADARCRMRCIEILPGDRTF